MLDDKTNKDTTVTFRISEDLKKKLEVMASKENRSLSNYIITLLAKAIEKSK
jgi:predicted HicB family RNase H-like nuclease